MRTTILILFFSAVFLGSCQAHMCLLSPAQRGSMTMFNKAASGDCHLMTSPCGGRAMDDVRLYLRAGQNFTVVFQKNLDHWNSATPGDFTGIIFYILIPFLKLFLCQCTLHFQNTNWPLRKKICFWGFR